VNITLLLFCLYKAVHAKLLRRSCRTPHIYHKRAQLKLMLLFNTL